MRNGIVTSWYITQDQNVTSWYFTQYQKINTLFGKLPLRIIKTSNDSKRMFQICDGLQETFPVLLILA
jgi:hypothetical protein